uniref:Uncharacterized protein n=1 Tax=Rhizophora mucronata TaxID=61149 RepID=A0A2P2QST0_RHIMU
MDLSEKNNHGKAFWANYFSSMETWNGMEVASTIAQ